MLMKGRMEMSGFRSKERKARSGVTVTRRVSRVSVGVMSLCALTMTLFVFPGAASAGVSCANEARRVEQGSTVLPDCRGYELVTAPGKDSGEPQLALAGFKELDLEGAYGTRASVTGGRMAWDAEGPLPGSMSPGLYYLSTRGRDGWFSENTIPPQSVENGTNCPTLIGIAAYSSDLSQGILADGIGQPGSFEGSEGLSCGHDEPRLAPVETRETPGELEGFQNLFLRDNEASPASYQLVDVVPADAPAPSPGSGHGEYYPASFLAGSSDLSHVVFEEELPLTPEAPRGPDDLYEWNSGVVRLVSILPDGEAVVGRLAGATRNYGSEVEGFSIRRVPSNIANFRHAVSTESSEEKLHGVGSRVFFDAEGSLYVRENAEREQSVLVNDDECTEPVKACTVQVDASQVGGSGGGGKFMVASESGSKVFFTDENRLTEDAKAEAGKPDLYEYDLEKPLGERLTDVTADSNEPADVLGVSGASEDGSYVYFVAEGKLAAGAPQGAVPGAEAVAGQPNLYLLHKGATTFIATLDATGNSGQYGDSCDWESPECLSWPLRGGLTARVSANGAFIGFDSDRSLTGYDNVGPACVPSLSSAYVVGFSKGPCEEIFLYNAAANSLGCASCDPNGAVPAGPALIRFPAENKFKEMRNTYPQRNVSDDGQVFFETPDALVPGDTNGKKDVYEYENGRQLLLSSGTSNANSYFMDASPNGDDVFFLTAQQLLPRDGDDAYDIYDARVDGGFPEQVSSGGPCEGEGCKGPASVAPALSAPSSATFSGGGNLSPSPVLVAPVVKPKAKSKSVKCRKGYERKKGRCVKKRSKAKSAGGERRAKR